MTTAPARTRPGTMSPVWALSRVEGRRLVIHPAFLVGVGFGVLLLIVNRVAESDIPIGFEMFRIIPIVVAVGTFIAANLGALRNRRHGTVELYQAEPLSARRRTAAHLLSVLWAVAATAVLAGVIFVTLAVSGGLDVGYADGIRHRTPTLIEMALGPIAVGLFGVVGIMVARWIPSVVVPMLAVVVALPYLTFESWTVAEGPTGWYAPMWSAAIERDFSYEVSGTGGSGYSPVADFAVAALAWHLVFLAGLIAIASVIALARHGWTRRLFAAGALGIGVSVVGAVMQIAAATPWR
jgi:hypothetical protein